MNIIHSFKFTMIIIIYIFNSSKINFRDIFPLPRPKRLFTVTCRSPCSDSGYARIFIPLWGNIKSSCLPTFIAGWKELFTQLRRWPDIRHLLSVLSCGSRISLHRSSSSCHNLLSAYNSDAVSDHTYRIEKVLHHGPARYILSHPWLSRVKL